MNLHLLRTFAAVAAHKSFSRAAEAIHVSQPAVSKAVRELEQQLDVALVARGRGELRLTEAGASLFEHARAIFQLEAAAAADLGARQRLQKGSLTVGASMTIATYILAPLIAKFLRRYPDIDVRIVSGNTETIERQLLEYALDVAFVEGPVLDPRIEVEPWREDEMVVLLAAGDPLAGRAAVSPSELSERRWIVREEGSGTRTVTDAMLRAAGVDVHHTLEVGSIGAVIDSVEAGVGLAMVSIEAARLHLLLDRVKLIPLPIPCTRQLKRLRLADKPISAAAEEFIRMANEDSASACQGVSP